MIEPDSRETVKSILDNLSIGHHAYAKFWVYYPNISRGRP